MRNKIIAGLAALGLGAGIVVLAAPAGAAERQCHWILVADAQGGGKHRVSVCDPVSATWNGPVFEGGGTF